DNASRCHLRDRSTGGWRDRLCFEEFGGKRTDYSNSRGGEGTYVRYEIDRRAGEASPFGAIQYLAESSGQADITPARGVAVAGGGASGQGNRCQAECISADRGVSQVPHHG